ncbi:unnamed protein product, partial [Owenia fusiformis]
AQCVNNNGSYACLCDEGFQQDGDIVRCVDNDECATLQPCDPDANCTNTDGSYDCTCKRGYEGNGTECENINECYHSIDPCGTDEICTDTQGSFFCSCKEGYSKVNSTCVEVIFVPLATTMAMSVANVSFEATFMVPETSTSPINANMVTITIEFEMTFLYGIYDNPLDPATISLNASITSMLSIIYQRVKSIVFKAVHIRRFYDGSIGVEHDVEYETELDTIAISEVALELLAAIDNGGGKLTDPDDKVYVVKGKPTIKQDGEDVVITEACSVYEHNSVCKNGGSCTNVNSSPRCSCNFMYKG